MKRLPLFFLALVVLLSACATKSAVRSAIQKDPALVMDVLRENRLLLLDIVQQALADQDRLAQEQQWRQELAHPFKPVIQGDRPIQGEVIAPVTVVEYSDFFCPYCGQGSQTLHALLERHPDEIKAVFKHFPLHDGSAYLASLFEAVAKQNPAAAWKFQGELFAAQKAVQQEGPDGPTLTGILAGLGVDLAKVKTDAASTAVQERIAADTEEAREFGFRGTPMYLVGGVAVRGAAPLAEFERVLELVRKGAEGAADCKDCGSVN
ncbi:MAG: DsbA family protein [Desulfovibrio sp.]